MVASFSDFRHLWALFKDEFVTHGNNTVNMRKIPLILTFLLIAFANVRSVQASSLVTVREDGEIILNVLADSDSILEIRTGSTLEVIGGIFRDDGEFGDKISLELKNGKASLSVLKGKEERSFEITGENEDLVEIIERTKGEKVKIGLVDGMFTLNQRGVIVRTPFSVEIDATRDKLSVKTPSGLRLLSILPYEALQVVRRARIIDILTPGVENIVLTEGSRGELHYKITGNKIIVPFNLFTYKVPIEAQVSASTGEVINIDQPLWFKVFDFLFT